jgi:hypothetical protein
MATWARHHRTSGGKCTPTPTFLPPPRRYCGNSSSVTFSMASTSPGRSGNRSSCRCAIRARSSSLARCRRAPRTPTSSAPFACAPSKTRKHCSSVPAILAGRARRSTSLTRAAAHPVGPRTPRRTLAIRARQPCRTRRAASYSPLTLTAADSHATARQSECEERTMRNPPFSLPTMRRHDASNLPDRSTGPARDQGVRQ